MNDEPIAINDGPREDTGGRPEGQSPRRHGGDRSTAAARNGSRVGRPKSPAKAAVAEAKRLTREKQEEAVERAIAEAEALGQDVTVASSAAALEAELAVNARSIAKKLIEAANGVAIQEVGKDGSPRIYTQPPSVPALVYISNRIAGTPISKADLLDLAERLVARKAGEGASPTSREDLMAELAAMVLELYRDARSARTATAQPRLEQRTEDQREAVDAD